MKCRRNAYRVRSIFSLERLEPRQAPAIASFRAGVNGFAVEDTSISAAVPTIGTPNSDQLEIAGELSASQTKQALIKFDGIFGNTFGQIPPNATILSANLCLWAVTGSGQFAQVELRRLLSPWDELSSNWVSWDNGIQPDGTEANTIVDLTLSATNGGFQLGGQSLRDTVQLWASGQPNHGWVLTTGDDNTWTFAGSNHPDDAKRPSLSIEFSAPGFENPNYQQLAGLPPEATRIAWFDWNDDLRNRRVSRVPLDRANTFYFSQSGDDIAGHGTIDSPWKTLAKAEALLTTTAGAGMRLRFRRGDVWRENTPMFLTARISGYTFDDYGDSALPKPLFSRFELLSSAGWVHVANDLYKFVNPPTVGWLREANDGFTRVYYREASSQGVSTRTQSWFYDAEGADSASQGTPTLYLNSVANPALLAGGFEACPADGLGWEVNGDNIRYQNIRIEGFGIQLSGQSYGFKILHQGLNQEFVGIGLEVYFTGYHAIGHIGQYQDTRGIATLIDVSAGYCVNRFGTGDPNSGDITVFVAYADYGKSEYIQYNCEARFGTLPSADWQATPGMAHGSLFYCHIGVSGTLDLIILEKTKIAAAQYPLAARNLVDNVAPASNLSEVRTFIVDDYGDGPSSRLFSDSVAAINCIVDLTAPPPPYDYHQSVYYYTLVGAWVINCSFRVDAQFQTEPYYSLIHGALRDKSTFINCQVEIFNQPNATYWQNPFLPAGSFYSDARIINTIVSFSTDGSTALGLVNDSEHLRNNAYYLPNLLDPSVGYSGDASGVELDRAYPVGRRPTPSSPLYNGGFDIGLEYDQNRQPRGDINTIGPLNGEMLPSPTDIKVRWGQAQTAVTQNMILSTPFANRIRVQFATDVDIAGSSLRLFNDFSEIPWSGFNYDLMTYTAEWTLSSPLPKGRYTLELDGQPIRAFSVLPGDFTGDGVVNASDFALFRSSFGLPGLLGDLDGDGQIDVLDFTFFRQAFGTTL